MKKKTIWDMHRLSVDEFRDAPKIPLTVVLDNVRSLNNIGSIFRTCDAFAVERLVLCGISQTPPSPEIHKTALGAEESVEWVHYDKTLDAVADLKAAGYTVCCLEQVMGSVSLEQFEPQHGKRYAFVAGHEVDGVAQEVVDACDVCLEIPQQGTKHSLNVAVSTGITIWHFFSKLLTLLLFMTVSTAAFAEENMNILYPRPLVQGDKIAIVSPSGPIKAELIDSAAAVLTRMGYEPVIYPHAKGKYGHFSGTHAERFVDLRDAFADPEIRAILCSRGGYGVVHNLDSLAKLPLRDDPKWVIGFSDISALHALLSSKGIASIHASMAKQVQLGDEHPDNAPLFDILTGTMPSYTFEPHYYNHPGTATGRLLGGNLAVLADLINTPFDIIRPGTILFIEDIAEPIYKVERIMYQLRLSGVLEHLGGLIVGQFTEYRADDNHKTMEDMIAEMVAPYKFPIAFNVPVGHVDHNVPLVESSLATLTVAADSVTLTMTEFPAEQ